MKPTLGFAHIKVRLENLGLCADHVSGHCLGAFPARFLERRILFGHNKFAALTPLRNLVESSKDTSRASFRSSSQIVQRAQLIYRIPLHSPPPVSFALPSLADYKKSPPRSNMADFEDGNGSSRFDGQSYCCA